MAKRAKVNKSEEVRKYIGQHPDAGPTEVSEALKKFSISPAFVSNIKTKMKNGGQKRKRRRGRRPAAAKGNSGSAAESVVAAARLIQLCGGAKEAGDAIRTAEKVADALAE